MDVRSASKALLVVFPGDFSLLSQFAAYFHRLHIACCGSVALLAPVPRADRGVFSPTCGGLLLYLSL